MICKFCKREMELDSIEGIEKDEVFIYTCKCESWVIVDVYGLESWEESANEN